MDLLISLVLLVIASPIILLLILLLAVANQGSVFFVQKRPGYKERPFYLVKFKTMNDKKDAAGELLPDKDRLTAIGKFVRKTSLDELPQLINVFKGDISLIGPRPLLMEYLDLYNPEQARRHNVRPGITGWAQVNGRNSISWEQKFEYDIYYVDNVSFKLDMRILLRTVKNVLKSEGISSETSVTMEKFQGTKQQ